MAYMAKSRKQLRASEIRYLGKDNSVIGKTTININDYRCPVCNKLMKLNERQSGQLIIECQECDINGRVQKGLKNDKYYLVSVPADKITRSLRYEAHIYFNAIVNNKILSKQDAYMWLTSKIYFSSKQDTMFHIGEMDSEMCKRVIDVCIKCLHDNKHRLKTKFDIKKNSYVSNNLELKRLVSEINKAVC